MPFTALELNNIANAAIDFYMKDQPLSQSIQDKPLLKALLAKKKNFPGGKDFIKGNVKGDYTTTFVGYSNDDTVTYANPANIKQFSYPWKELHAGISLTLSELKRDGISVVDSLNGEKTTEHSDREMTAISNMLEDKLEDMTEGMARSLNNIFFLDGSQSSKVFPGLNSFVTGTNTSGTTGGIDRAANTWWRNRALVGTSKTTASATNQTLTQMLRKEVRQLRRYGGRPNLILAGSTFLNLLETEVTAKGYYTQTGFQNNGATEIGLPAITMRDVGDFMYDPTLDDNNQADYAYFLDTRHLFPMIMDGEDMKTHAPARPPEKYVLYRATTWTGTLICRKLNAHGVYQAA